MLEPQPELAAQIAAWRAERLALARASAAAGASEPMAVDG
jgi:hypothetical protein